MRRRFALLAALLLLAAGPAAAAEVDQIVQQLQDSPVLVDERSAVVPDVALLEEELSALPVPTYVVVLPQADADAEDSGIDGLLLRVVEALEDPRAVVVVVTDGGELQAGEGGASGVNASAALDRIVLERGDQDFDGEALTGALVEFAQTVEREGQEGGARGITGSPRQAIGVAGVAAVALLAGGLLWARSQRKARMQAPLTDVTPDESHW